MEKKSCVCLTIRAITIWQTVMQQNSVKALYQDWAYLKEITGFAAFSRNVSQPPAKVWKELTSWSAWYSQVLEGNGSKHDVVPTIQTRVFHFFAGGSEFGCRSGITSSIYYNKLFQSVVAKLTQELWSRWLRTDSFCHARIPELARNQDGPRLPLQQIATCTKYDWLTALLG